MDIIEIIFFAFGIALTFAVAFIFYKIIKQSKS